MRVRALLSSSDNERVVVVLEDVAQRLQFAFSADLHEARRLGRALDSAECTCNPVYDFIESSLSAFQAAMTRVVLDDAGASGIHAVIWLQRADVSLTIPCYPPDALGLALRAKVPIYATAAALAHATPLRTSDDVPRPGPPEVRRWLEGVSPDDFRLRSDQE
jgi:bifunctional DNase/RNase